MFPTINRESSMLGFGCMRFPTTPDGKIDESEAIRMIRHAIDNGVRYIDTAYPYHGGESEIVIGKALKDGYREKVILTTKLPVWLVKTHEDMMKFLDEQLKKLDTPYVDFYILHAMNNERMDAMQKLDYKRFYAEAIAHGKVRYPGFSFHDDAKAFLRILHDWDQWGMCQVQMNILDDENQATLEGIREAGRRGVGVVVMEPLRGGLLANPPVDVKAVYDAYAVQRSPVEWGFRYLYAMPEVITILSGMSTWAQVTDNLRIFDMAKRPTLTDEELALYQKVKATYLARTKTRCTAASTASPARWACRFRAFSKATMPPCSARTAPSRLDTPRFRRIMRMRRSASTAASANMYARSTCRLPASWRRFTPRRRQNKSPYLR